MQRETWKIFLACAIGAGLGSLVALEVATMFWWVGLIVGCLTGYLSYEWRAVLRAIPQAYRAARELQAPPLAWRIVGWSILGACSAVSYLLGIICLVHFVGGEGPLYPIRILVWCFAMSLLTTFMYIDVEIKEESLRYAKQRAYYLFPPLLLFWHLPRGIIWLVPRIPSAIIVAVVGAVHGITVFIRFIIRFVWQLFIRIHSEMRLLCGMDAMIGAAIGYFAGSALIGALTGGAFGVINYAVVTERWLKRRGYLPIRS